ncbi:MAG: 3-hydroxyacyl-ACP dehydratase FabZ [Desulfobacterales bacterium]|nr:3-hydroxyacyl-ACP dehydratase FabZ [Desulfobacterales bacterium]
MEYDIVKILNILPHRYPFIMIDRIIELVPGKKVIALKNVSINEPCFQGHFPENPIMPGVLMLEAMGQAGGILAHKTLNLEKDDLLYFIGIDKVRFRKPVFPGDQLIIELEILRQRGKVVKMKGSVKVDGKIAAEGEFMTALGGKKHDTSNSNN